ncbi:GNAT family N-acetyltransferase [Rhodanobacter lindaniclasticus]
MQTEQDPHHLIELGDARLRLSPWAEDDAGPLVDAVQESIASVGRWLPWCHAGYGREEASAWISHCRAGRQAGSHFAFAMRDARDGSLLGGVGLNQFEPVHRRANLGYWVRHRCQQQGLATAAAQLVTRFGFERLGLIRIEIVALPDNAPSRATALRIGARFEAIARHRLLVDGQPRDAAVYGLLPSDLP